MIVCETGLPLTSTGRQRGVGIGPFRAASVIRACSAIVWSIVSRSPSSLISSQSSRSIGRRRGRFWVAVQHRKLMPERENFGRELEPRAGGGRNEGDEKGSPPARERLRCGVARISGAEFALMSAKWHRGLAVRGGEGTDSQRLLHRQDG
jgi:hypothetical protein